jgi:hypothetical protein
MFYFIINASTTFGYNEIPLLQGAEFNRAGVTVTSEISGSKGIFLPDFFFDIFTCKTYLGLCINVQMYVQLSTGLFWLTHGYISIWNCFTSKKLI